MTNVHIYGVSINTIHWACKNGGDDITGTKEEMDAWVADALRVNEGPLPGVRYAVEPYVRDGLEPGCTEETHQLVMRMRAECADFLEERDALLKRVLELEAQLRREPSP